MAGKRTQPTIDNTSTVLVKSHTAFKNEIQKRIDDGKRIHSEPINNHQEYAELNKEYDTWNDYNLELLRRSFNTTENEYFRDYNYTPSTGMVIKSYGSQPSSLSLQQLAARTKTTLDERIDRLQKIKDKADLIQTTYKDQEQITRESNVTLEDIGKLNLLFDRFHRVAQILRCRHGNRETILLNDEYDVQDLLRSLLQIYFSDVREGDFAPSNAGGNSRIDFSLREEQIIIEVKMTNERLSDKQIGDQILIDIGRYKMHPHCKNFVVFIYDKGDFVRNKKGLISDLERESSNRMNIKVHIKPD